MQKSEFLHLTNETETALRNWIQKRIMPWALGDGKGKWARHEYSPWRAVLYIAFKELIAKGMPGSKAAEILLNRELQVLAGPLVFTETKKGEFSGSRGGRSSLLPTKRIADDKWLMISHAGSVDGLLLFPMTVKEFSKGLDSGDYFLVDQENHLHFSMVNLTQAVRLVQTRAKEIDLSLEW